MSITAPCENQIAPPLPPARWRREHWVDLGLTSLAASGPDSLKIERLCEVAGRSKGSFYHHFHDQQAFIDALLERWRASHRASVAAALSAVQNRRESIVLLDYLSARTDPALETGMRRLAHINTAAQDAIAETDAARIDTIASLYAGKTDAVQARELAEIEYAVYVGHQVLGRDFADGAMARRAALFRLMVKTVIRLAPRPDGT
ncbi:TetR/AcrR family transcriptional regulator [Parvularcula sp. LCG005]|uniref:TetR/AcrR family transcriptional regulator n=1 Tax=Parvularcula sp. LCG005 TaxID=3078805 RepID=UPI00294205BE|nr:TetR/AcrR family transcriptional regulator [Parvularcula sp. LCG005]WOI53390.1 TetR/AcrR family transcriptional regulator [Parvularcula sp. LCG005]